MRAELVIIGTELLLGEIVDTNAAYLARELADCGIDVYHKSTVGDNWIRVVQALSQALERSDIVITTGGLGPTMDDITREAVAAVLNQPLEKNAEAEANLEEIFRRRGRMRVISQNNYKQALLPSGAQIIRNNWGTAPGFVAFSNHKFIISLPGVPHELYGMFSTYVKPFLAEKYGGTKLFTRSLNFVGIGESMLEDKVQGIIKRQSNPTVAPYASVGKVRLRVTAKAENAEEADRLMTPVEEEILSIVGDWFYGYDNESLESILGKILTTKKQTIAVAESCSGGLIGHRLTNVPGSSAYFERGLITYSNQAKRELLGVSPETIMVHGAVSEECAREMAEGVRRTANADWGLAVTGIAGPGGGTPEKPVGLVYISLSGEGYNNVERHVFVGEREDIKLRAAEAALYLLYQAVKP